MGCRDLSSMLFGERLAPVKLCHLVNGMPICSFADLSFADLPPGFFADDVTLACFSDPAFVLFGELHTLMAFTDSLALLFVEALP